MAGDDHRHPELTRLEQQMSRLRTDLSRKADADELSTLRNELAGQDRNIDDALRRLDEVTGSLEDVRSDLTGRTDAIAQRLRWLEHHVRISAGARIADLDRIPGLATAAAQAQRGAILEAELLADTGRRHLEERAAQFHEWRAAHQDAVDTVVACSSTIAHTEPTASERAAAVTTFRRATEDLRALRQREQSIAEAASEAATILSADDEQRASRASAIADGQRAHAELCTRIRTALQEMIGRAELPPTWFDTVLGPGPPVDAGPWMQTAVDLIAYRVTYGVTDTVVALGDPPGPDSPTQRREWYLRLSALLRRLR